jgi:uncharacterized membrane protein YwzB
MKKGQSLVVIITIFVVVIVVETELLAYFNYINTVRNTEINLITIIEIFVTCSFNSEVVSVYVQYKKVKERDQLETRVQMFKNIKIYPK